MKNVKTGHTRPIVCLDAGHYGKYNRSPAVKDYYESDMVWKLHNHLKAQLERYGIEVRLTRAEQAKDMGLTARGKASSGCDLFLSIHSNAVGNAVNENVDYPLAIVQLDGKGNELGNALAKTIQETMGTKQTGRITTRKGNGGEYYGVLRGAAAVGTMGMILEHSFHTNTRATNWLMDDANLQALAAAEAKTISEWFGMEQTTGNTETAPEAQDKPDTVEIDAAKSGPDKAKAGQYKVQSSDGTLNLRAGASTSKALIEVMPNGTLVRCYGYYTGNWLYGVSVAGNTGFCHQSYLTKV